MVEKVIVASSCDVMWQVAMRRSVLLAGVDVHGSEVVVALLCGVRQRGASRRVALRKSKI